MPRPKLTSIKKKKTVIQMSNEKIMNEIQCFSIRYLFKFWQNLIIITDLVWAALHDRGIFWYKSRPLHSNTHKYLHRCQGQLVQHKKQVMIWKGTQTMDCGIIILFMPRRQLNTAHAHFYGIVSNTTFFRHTSSMHTQNTVQYRRWWFSDSDSLEVHELKLGSLDSRTVCKL